MSFSEMQDQANKPPASGCNRAEQGRQEPSRASCPYEAHVVTDPNASRIMLMLLRDFVEQGVAHPEAQVDALQCPMRWCFASFTQPMDLISHLMNCPKVRHGEFGCLKCKNCHVFPTDERAWSGWDGWKQPEDPALPHRQKRSFSSKMKDTISGIKHRGQRRPRRSESSSSAWSSASVASSSSSSSASSPVAPNGYPGPSDWRWSAKAFETDYHLLESSQDQRPQKSSQAQPCLPEFPADNYSCHELAETSGISKLSTTSVSGIMTPPLSNGPQQQSFEPSMWGDSSRTAMSTNTSTSTSTSTSSGAQKQDDRINLLSSDYLVSPQSSGDRVSAAGSLHVDVNGTTQFFDQERFVESPVEMAESPPGKQAPWLQASAPRITNPPGCAWEFNKLPAGPASQIPTAHNVQMPSAFEPLGALFPSNNWSQQPPPAPQPQHAFVGASCNGSGMDLRTSLDRHTGRVYADWDGGGGGGGDAAVADHEPTIANYAEDPASPASELPADIPPVELSAENFRCDRCKWIPRADGIPENFPNYLRKHMITHRGLRLRCSYPGCGRDFTRSDNLKKHRKTIHGVDTDGGGGGDDRGALSRGNNGGRRRQNVADLEGPGAERLGTLRWPRGRRAWA